MALIRSIGKWALAGLMVNAMIGSGIFGVPGELIKLLGAASPGVFIVAGLAMTAIVACFVEVASQFPAAGGPYLYARTAFGRPAGLQVAWFSALAPIAAAAAQAKLFVNYLAGFQPALGEGLARYAVIAGLIGVPAAANSMDANAGRIVSSILVIVKLLPLAVLIAVGLTHVGVSHERAVEETGAAYGPSDWFTAALLAAVCFGGFEDPLATAGEVTDPRRSIGFALGVSLAVCIALYALIQLITLRALGAVSTPHPLATVAGALLGSGGGAFVACAVMASTAGAIPRLSSQYHASFLHWQALRPCAAHRYSRPCREHRLGLLPSHRSDRFLSSSPKAAQSSRHLHAGRQTARKQAPSVLVPGHPYLPVSAASRGFGTSSVVYLRSSQLHISDEVRLRLFLNAHHADS